MPTDMHGQILAMSNIYLNLKHGYNFAAREATCDVLFFSIEHSHLTLSTYTVLWAEELPYKKITLLLESVVRNYLETLL